MIEEWRSAWRMFSVQAAAMIALWAMLPDFAQDAVTRFLRITDDGIVLFLAGLVIVGRLKAQPLMRKAWGTMTDMIQVGWSVILGNHAPFQPAISLFLMDREEVARRYAATHGGVIRPAYSPKDAPCDTPSSPQP